MGVRGKGSWTGVNTIKSTAAEINIAYREIISALTLPWLVQLSIESRAYFECIRMNSWMHSSSPHVICRHLSGKRLTALKASPTSYRSDSRLIPGWFAPANCDYRITDAASYLNSAKIKFYNWLAMWKTWKTWKHANKMNSSRIRK